MKNKEDRHHSLKKMAVKVKNLLTKKTLSSVWCHGFIIQDLGG